MTQASIHMQPPNTTPEMLLASPTKLLFSSSDPDEVCSKVGRTIHPHRLKLLTSGKNFNARMYHMELGEISLSRLSHGTSVHIEPAPQESYFLVQMPLSGIANIETAGQRIDSSAELACVFSPDDDTRMSWGEDNDQLMLRISRTLVERTLIGYLGHKLDTPLRFELGFSWRACSTWCNLLYYIQYCAMQTPCVEHHPLVLSQVEQLAASVLLTSCQHNHTFTKTRRSNVLPRHVRTTQAYMHAHVHEPICVEQLAQISGVSVRGLYAAFKEFLGISPMQYLRDLRMERARTDLISGAASVASVALRWGFTHLGRFSSEYQRRYGETPSQTMRHR